MKKAISTFLLAALVCSSSAGATVKYRKPASWDACKEKVLDAAVSQFEVEEQVDRTKLLHKEATPRGGTLATSSNAIDFQVSLGYVESEQAHVFLYSYKVMQVDSSDDCRVLALLESPRLKPVR